MVVLTKDVLDFMNTNNFKFIVIDSKFNCIGWGSGISKSICIEVFENYKSTKKFNQFTFKDIIILIKNNIKLKEEVTIFKNSRSNLNIPLGIKGIKY